MPNYPVDLKRYFINVGKALCYLILFFGMQVVFTLFYMLAGAITAAASGASGDAVLAAATQFALLYASQMTLFSNLMVLMFLSVFFALRKKNLLRECSLVRPHGTRAAYCTALMPAFYLAVSILISMLPEAWLSSYLEASSSIADTGLLPFLSVAILAPAAEEIIFRGLILSRISRVLPGLPAVFLTAALFAACHGQIVWMLYAFAMGTLFCLLTYWSGSLWPSLISHILFNTVGQVALYLPESVTATALFPLGLLCLSALGCAVVYLANIRKIP